MIKFTKNIYSRSATEGIPVSDLVRKAHEEEILKNYADDKRSVVEIAMQEAGFNKFSNMYDIWNYSQSSDNDNIIYPAYIKETLETVRDENSQDIIYPSLIAEETTIPSDTYKGVYIDWGTEKNKNALVWQGVEEGAEIPFVKAKTGETSLRTYKNAIGVRQTYETMRRITVPIVQNHLNRLARRFGTQNLNEILYTFENGDGNDNAIPTALKFQTASAGILDKNDLIDFSLNFNDISEGLNADIYVCTKGMYKALLGMFFKTDDISGFVPGAVFTFPQNILNGAKVFYSRELSKGTGSKERLLGINKSNGVRKVTEAGSLISDEDKNTSNQTIEYVMSENSAFQKLDKYSVAELIIK